MNCQLNRAARSSGQKHLDMLHGVFFDGSSYFVDSVNFVGDEDTKLVRKFASFDAACEFADLQNEEMYA